MSDYFIRTNRQLIERNKTLQKIKKILDDLNIRFFLEGGVLLGAIRNNEFIKWDHDVELGVISENLYPNILKILTKAEKQNLKISFVDNNYNNLKINIYEHWHSKFSILGFKKTSNFLERDIYKYPSKFFYPMKSILFMGKKYEIPNNIDEFLTWTYGDWRKEVKSRNNRVYLNNDVFNSKLKIYTKKFIPFLKNFINKYFYKATNFLNYINREPLFKFMIKSLLNKKKILFYDIGSNDGSESVLVLKKNIESKSIIIEPYKKHIEIIKERLSKLKINKNRYKILNFAASNKNYIGNFYINLKLSNLSTSFKQNEGKSIKIKYKKLSSLLSKKKNNNFIIFKMDLEGSEYYVLKDIIKFLIKNKNIAILIELHPTKYKRGQMEILFKQLFKNGYNIKFVESAGSSIPFEFKKNNLKPFLVSGSRGLYKNVSKKFVLENAFLPKYKLSNFGKGFIDKLIRSIMLEKNE